MVFENGISAAGTRQDDELKGHVTKLNQQFAKWVQDKLTEQPHHLWTDGVRDYVKYAQELTDEYHSGAGIQKSPQELQRSEASVPSVSAGVPTSSVGNNLFGAQTSSPFTQMPASPFTFTTTPKVESNQQTISAGNAAFNFTPGASFMDKPSGAPGMGVAQDEEEPPRSSSPSLKASNDESSGESLFRSKTKLFKLDSTSKGWNELGIGQVDVQKPKDDKGQSFIVFRNEAGKVLLRACLYAKLTVRVQNKAATMALFPAKELGESESKNEPITFTFRFGKIETVQRFEKIINANCPQ